MIVLLFNAAIYFKGKKKNNCRCGAGNKEHSAKGSMVGVAKPLSPSSNL